ncbi:MAG TPA: acetyl-CoA acetyltransferase [Candidatus Binatia bacterium]|nr:acetyl-CoA acetyltransferase [Candidatus Binatia bacterium]
MDERVAIVGIGMSAARPSTAHLSFKELTFETAQKAYADAAIKPGDVDSFVTCAEDLTEGVSIFDEYTPDQLGAVQKPMHTLTQDGLHGIADAVMQLRSGIASVVVVEAHSKHSNMENANAIVEYALDPIYNRPLAFNPHAIAALEMNCFLHETGIPVSRSAQVAAKNRRYALKNLAAAYPMNLRSEDVDASPWVAYPLREGEIARSADGCVVVVLATETRAKQCARPVWVRGVGFANDSPTLESRDWIAAQYVRSAAALAYRQAGINDPANEIDLFEIDDTYAYKELQHAIALGIYSQSDLAERAEERVGGLSGTDGIPVNVSGGSLGMGHTLEASGLYRLAEVVLQLRGDAGPRQLAKARVGLAQSWRGVPTTSGAVVILGVE